MSDKDFKAQMDGFKANLDKVWAKENNMDLSKVKFEVVSNDFSADNLKSGENLVTFGTKGFSRVTGDKNNEVFINVNSGEDDYSHEFGHVVGLADRYDDGAISSQSANKNISRLTVPHSTEMYPDEQDYDPSTNMMSSGSGVKLTQIQKDIANSSNTETSQSKFYIYPNRYSVSQVYGDKNYAAIRLSDGSFSKLGTKARKWLGNTSTGNKIKTQINSIWDGK